MRYNKKLSILLLAATIFISACSKEPDVSVIESVTPPETTIIPSTSISPKETPQLSTEAETTSDELIFEPDYAESVEINGAREMNQHINIVVKMPEDSNAGMVTQMVFNEAYDFLQLELVKSAKTVTIGVMRGKFRIAQITIDVAKFKAEDHIVKSVLKAATIDKMDDNVKEYGEVMNLW